MIGVSSKAECFRFAPLLVMSPVEKIQATTSACTLSGVICAAVEKRCPPASPP
jgi:hypothetical protein